MSQKIPKAKRRENVTFYITPEAKKLVREMAKKYGLSRSLIANRWLLLGAKADACQATRVGSIS